MGIMAQGLVVQEKIGGNKWSAASPAAKLCKNVGQVSRCRVAPFCSHSPVLPQPAFFTIPFLSTYFGFLASIPYTAPWHFYFISFAHYKEGLGEACLISSLVYNFQRSTRNGNYSWCHTQGKCSDWGRLTAANTICTEKNGPLFLNWKSTLDYW